MPVAGHWHLRAGAAQFMERRSLEATDATEPAVHGLTVDRAVEEWKRLEPAGHRATSARLSTSSSAAPGAASR